MSNLFDQNRKEEDNLENKRKEILNKTEISKDNPFIIHSEPKKTKRSITLSEDVDEFINNFSDIVKMSRSETIDILLREAIQESESISELANREDAIKMIFDKFVNK